MKGKLNKGLLIFLLFTLARSFADIGWYGDSPGHVTLEGEEHENIVLKSEEVEIELNGGNRAFGHVNVNGRFEFYNDGPATHVMMAYPLYDDAFPIQRLDKGWVNDLLTERGLSEENPVNHRVFSRIALDTADFRSGFDSRIKDYRDIKITVDGVEPLEEFVFRYDLDSAFLKTSRYVRWPVKFDAHESKSVTVYFANPYQRDNLGDGGNNWYAFRYEYPLYTGNTWKGPIGRGEIQLVYENETVGGPIFFVSPGCPAAEVSADESRTEIKWSFKKFEPPESAKIVVYKGNKSHMVPPQINPRTKRVGLEIGGGEAGVALRGNLPLKEKPIAKANPVAGAENLEKGTPLSVRASRGEWWYVKLNEGTEGWLRWREVDPVSGQEIINAKFVGVKLKGY